MDKTALFSWIHGWCFRLWLHGGSWSSSVPSSCRQGLCVSAECNLFPFSIEFPQVYLTLSLKRFSAHLRLPYLHSAGSRESVWGGESLALGWHDMSVNSDAASPEWRSFSCWRPAETQTHTLTHMVLLCIHMDAQKHVDSHVWKRLTHIPHSLKYFPQKQSGCPEIYSHIHTHMYTQKQYCNIHLSYSKSRQHQASIIALQCSTPLSSSNYQRTKPWINQSAQAGGHPK